MNEDRKKRGLANGKFFTAVAICALFLGSGNVMAAQTASDDSQGVQEQMQSISVTVTVVDTRKNHFAGHTSPFCSCLQSSNKVFPLFQRNRVLVKTRR